MRVVISKGGISTALSACSNAHCRYLKERHLPSPAATGFTGNRPEKKRAENIVIHESFQ
jgi:hypothetical protein